MPAGTLYIVATPIGNLQDISLRALETLKAVHCIAAEDTRQTVKLLNHFGIKQKLISFHEHSAPARVEELLQMLAGGQDIALVSDAGTPLVSDPGSKLVAACVDRGIGVTAVPGACAAIAALCMGGLSCEQFLFQGFLPRDKTRKQVLDQLCLLPYAIVLYESPHHLRRTLQDLAARMPERNAALAKEITKLHEQVFRGTISQLQAQFSGDAPLRGEYVLILEKQEMQKSPPSPDEICAALKEKLAQGMRGKTAVAQVANELGAPKNQVYDLLLQL